MKENHIQPLLWARLPPGPQASKVLLTKAYDTGFSELRELRPGAQGQVARRRWSEARGWAIRQMVGWRVWNPSHFPVCLVKSCL